jgi:hypothetical protein
VGIPSPSSLQKDSCHLFNSPPTIPFLSLSSSKPLIGSINILLRGKKNSMERTWGEFFRMIKIQQHHLTSINTKTLMGFKMKLKSSSSCNMWIADQTTLIFNCGGNGGVPSYSLAIKTKVYCTS